MNTPEPLPSASVPPPRPAPPPRPPASAGSSLLGCGFALSFVGNLLALVVILALCVGLLSKSAVGEGDGTGPIEKYHSGNRTSTDKVVIVSLEGIILEGMLTNIHKQIEQAAKDDHVKAVVLRINSPGGSITASDDLHEKIVKLRDGDSEKKQPARPLVVSMGSLAASGGYYVAVPAKTIFAERTTMTGSIGVYASLPDATELSEKVGFTMRTIKAGAIKDSGSPFREMKPEEQIVWQDLVNESYDQFLKIVTDGRPALTRDKLLERFTVQPLTPDPKAPGTDQRKPYTRYRADGGIFVARQAKELQLIDQIGTIDDAVQEAAKLANLGSSFQAIKYEKRKTLADLLLGVQANPPSQLLLDPARLSRALSPRLWYLAPGHEAAGLLDATRAAP